MLKNVMMATSEINRVVAQMIDAIEKLQKENESLKSQLRGKYEDSDKNEQSNIPS